MTLHDFKELLLTVTPNVYHLEAVKTDEYLVYHQTGVKTLRGGDSVSEQGIRVAVDFFTKNEKSETPERLFKVLSENVFVTDYITDYEHDTKYLHHAYTCEVL